MKPIKEMRRIKVARTFARRICFVPVVHLGDKEPYEFTLSEFKNVFGPEALKLTGYKSASSAEALLFRAYITIIAEALERTEMNVCIEGIELLAFRSEYRVLVKKYCRRMNITL